MFLKYVQDIGILDRVDFSFLKQDVDPVAGTITQPRSTVDKKYQSANCAEYIMGK